MCWEESELATGQSYSANNFLHQSEPPTPFGGEFSKSFLLFSFLWWKFQVLTTKFIKPHQGFVSFILPLSLFDTYKCFYAVTSSMIMLRMG